MAKLKNILILVTLTTYGIGVYCTREICTSSADCRGEEFCKDDVCQKKCSPEYKDGFCPEDELCVYGECIDKCSESKPDGACEEYDQLCHYGKCRYVCSDERPDGVCKDYEQLCMDGTCQDVCSVERPDGVCKDYEQLCMDGTCQDVCSPVRPDGVCKDYEQLCMDGTCQDVCSPGRPDGVCKDYKQLCVEGTCQDVCSSERPDGVCKEYKQLCMDGKCQDKCSDYNPHGVCEDYRQLCMKGLCLGPCSDLEPNGLCDCNKTCIDGRCVGPCSYVEPDGVCDVNRTCVDGVCYAICSDLEPEGVCDTNRTCVKGTCVDRCSEAAPDGICEKDKVCVDGRCIGWCSYREPEGACEGNKVCVGGRCFGPCSDNEPDGTCETNKTCIRGRCTDRRLCDVGEEGDNDCRLRGATCEERRFDRNDYFCTCPETQKWNSTSDNWICIDKDSCDRGEDGYNECKRRYAICTLNPSGSANYSANYTCECPDGQEKRGDRDDWICVGPCSYLEKEGLCDWNKTCVDGRCIGPCSEDEPEGLCESNRTCIEGRCTGPCSYDIPDGVCKKNKMCIDGECIGRCSRSEPEGICNGNKVCRGGKCVGLCSERDPNGLCEHNKTCVAGVCTDSGDNGTEPCSYATPDGYCEKNKMCIGGRCVGRCSYDEPEGLCDGNKLCRKGKCIGLCSEWDLNGLCDHNRTCVDGVCTDSGDNVTESDMCEPGQVGYRDCQSRNATCKLQPHDTDGYRCVCPPLQKWSNDTGDRICVESDPCLPGQVGDRVCGSRNATCKPGPYGGEYRCVCPPVQKWSNNTGDRICVESDICEKDGPGQVDCDKRGAECVANDTDEGVYSCICPPGYDRKYQGEEWSCAGLCDIPSYHRECDEKSLQCEVTPNGTISCQCPPSFLPEPDYQGRCKLAAYSYLGRLYLHIPENANTSSSVVNDHFDEFATKMKIKESLKSVRGVRHVNVLECSLSTEDPSCVVELQFGHRKSDIPSLLRRSCHDDLEYYTENACIIYPSLLLKRDSLNDTSFEPTEQCSPNHVRYFCPSNTNCYSRKEGYACECKEGYTTESYVTYTGREDHRIATCTDVCDTNPCGIKGKCIKLAGGGHLCQCPDGNIKANCTSDISSRQGKDQSDENKILVISIVFGSILLVVFIGTLFFVVKNKQSSTSISQL